MKHDKIVFPKFSLRNITIYIPAAKSQGPWYLKTPVLVPVWLDTITLSPSFKGPPPVLEAKLKVDPAGDGVFDLFNLRVEEDGDIEARALKLRLVEIY